MIFRVDLTSENTTIKEDVGSNLQVEIVLNGIWDEIKNYDRIYVHSILKIPIWMQERASNQEIILRSNYKVATIDTTGEAILVVQKGYYEGTCKDCQGITVNCTIWRYCMSSVDGVEL